MRRKWLLLLFAFALVGGMFSLPPAPVAEAGSNGQQIMLYAGKGLPYITYMKVSGYNNKYPSQWVTFTRYYSPATSTAETNGWWWKGNVNIEWKLNNGTSNRCTIYVPPSQPQDWVYASANRGPGLC